MCLAIMIILSTNDDKRLQTLDRITSYTHGITSGKVWKLLWIKYTAIKTFVQRMTNFDDVKGENKTTCNPYWS